MIKPHSHLSPTLVVYQSPSTEANLVCRVTAPAEYKGGWEHGVLDRHRACSLAGHTLHFVKGRDEVYAPAQPGECPYGVHKCLAHVPPHVCWAKPSALHHAYVRQS